MNRDNECSIHSDASQHTLRYLIRPFLKPDVYKFEKKNVKTASDTVILYLIFGVINCIQNISYKLNMLYHCMVL